jgi:PleD family two-component response regulator
MSLHDFGAVADTGVTYFSTIVKFNRDQNGLLDVYLGVRSHSELMALACFFRSRSKASAVMVMDYSATPAVVLVVEDEMLLRMRAVDMVEDAGFTSVEAVDADEAVAILESRSDITLMFTDIQMPGGMDGLKLAHTVHERYTSGGTRSWISENA